MKSNFRARIYPTGSSEGIAVDLDLDGEVLVASDGVSTASWPMSSLRLNLGGCAEDRVVVHCPSGDTLISTDMKILGAFANCPKLKVQVDSTRGKHTAATFRRRLGTTGMLMLWWGLPLTILGLPFLVIAIALCAHFLNPDADSTQSTVTATAGEQQKQQPQEAAAPAENADAEELNQYNEAVVTHIEKYFHRPKRSDSLKARARFTIKPDGKVSSFSFTQSSGNKAFDLAAKNAVLNHQPLPAPPDPTRPVEFDYDF